MPALAIYTRRARRKACGAAILAMLLAGCASQHSPGYYDNARDNTQRDAMEQAQGSGPGVQAQSPSQLHLGFGPTQKKPSAAEAANEKAAQPDYVRPLAEPKTFLGTVPCLVNGNTCSANRITLTLAPSGLWRSRTLVLDGPDAQHSTVQQGCWQVIGSSPLRILLQLDHGGSKASLTFVNDNLLRIDSLDNIRPTLEYRLTRQADIDGIDELNKAPHPSCNR
ncbi:hypothetical protein KVP10_16150 [Candidimonas humi]|uniref:NlpE N-terminal domain-containing protein n=1 Tax=Candidimonas humi TaxID=683355 RepID=A0ABV8NYY1_9BURK|nr:hypothetical protein [Candidimonas humi]MBV6306424.1 hypothetical protein [Candidimonas humi]